MSIGPINGFQPLPFAAAAPRVEQPAKPETTGFADRIGSAVEDLARAQSNASEAARAFERGERSDLAAVMVEQQISSLGFQFALNVRNKALGAYRDIMNMPV
ncbi:MAG: flagellar hook-basal body complex protein FliE [Pseudomonadota bacterium]|jgi:flagellar hook-basal body complex protein FliE